MTIYELLERQGLNSEKISSVAVYLGGNLVTLISSLKFELIEIDESLNQVRFTGIGGYSSSFFVNFDELRFSFNYRLNNI